MRLLIVIKQLTDSDFIQAVRAIAELVQINTAKAADFRLLLQIPAALLRFKVLLVVLI